METRYLGALTLSSIFLPGLDKHLVGYTYNGIVQFIATLVFLFYFFTVIVKCFVHSKDEKECENGLNVVTIISIIILVSQILTLLFYIYITLFKPMYFSNFIIRSESADWIVTLSILGVLVYPSLSFIF